MLIDCDQCSARGAACGDCVLSVLLDPPPRVQFDSQEQVALATLADAGLVPRLRHARGRGPGSAAVGQ